MNGGVDKAILHLLMDGRWSVKDHAEFLQSLRYAHSSVDVFLREVSRDHFLYHSPAGYPYLPPRRLLSKDYLYYRFVSTGARAVTGSADRPLTEYYQWHREYTL